MFTYNLWMGCLLSVQTLSCAFYTIFQVLKLDLVMQALLLDYNLALAKNTRTPCVHLVFI